MKAINRVKKYIDFKGFNNSSFEKKNELSNGYIGTQIKRNADLGEGVLKKILDNCLDISPEWLLTGEGEMLKNNYTNTSHSMMQKDTAMYQKAPKGIPLIPLDAMAGFGTGTMQVMPYDTEQYIVPEFSELNVDYMIRVKGSSMYPKYNSGDIVACRKLPLDTFFQWNKVYVLDTIQGPMIKRIKKSEKENQILCVSDNKSYDPFNLELSEIHSLSIVIGVIRLE